MESAELSPFFTNFPYEMIISVLLHYLADYAFER